MNYADAPPPHAFETIAIWLRNIGTEDELPAPVDEVAHLLSEIERMEDKCNQQAMVLQRLFPDRNAGVYFICGEGGEKDRNGLPERIHVCPAYGCSFSVIYTHGSLEPPKHKFWMPGEPDCPRDVKAPNGELHTLRCKVCGQDDPRSERCNPADHPLAQMVRLDEGLGLTASGMEAATAGETPQSGSTEGDSPTAESGDAQKDPSHD